MANVKLTKNVPVDLLAVLGVIAGTPVDVIALTNGAPIRVYNTAGSPDITSDDFIPIKFGTSKVTTDAGDAGVWGVCTMDGGALDVREV